MNTLYSFGVEEHPTGSILDYYWFLETFNPVQCESIISICKKYEKQEASTFKGDSKDTRNSTVRWIPLNDETEFIFKQISDCVLEANRELFKIDIYGFTESLQFTEYEGAGTHYDWHPDIGADKNKRKLSIVIQLSDENDYEGGDLMINSGVVQKAPRERGNIIIFPSFLLHKVTPLISGNRYSIVSWVSGPPWR